MDLNAKSVRDMMTRNTSKTHSRPILNQHDKENDPAGMNRLKQIEVSLPVKAETEINKFET